MFKKEIRKTKALIVICLALVAVGGFNLAMGINDNRAFSIFVGVFGIVVSSICAMQNIKVIERYKVMEMKQMVAVLLGEPREGSSIERKR